ncbi:MAG: Heparinase family protein [Acidobacteriaceae bacterium]|nr:Heparinase family protein [Acidobacteriaceae bacterium]
MSSHEIQTRVGQEVNKRLDWALYRTGLLSTTNGLKNSECASDRRFFFSEDNLPTITQILREHLPQEARNITTEADEICGHRFRLLGYENLDYGTEIDWHLDAIHGKRAPLKPWFKIRFLDFAEVGDHKVTWELNRHQHLVTLAKAWCLTHDDKYVAELMHQLYSWQGANPYPMGINWGSSLEVAFRSLSWLWVRSLLAKCPAVPASFSQDLLKALALNGRYIERYLSTYFSPNTHLLGEAVALFFIGTLCPEVPSSGKWGESGWKIVLEEAERQVRPDGVYFEQSLYYHVYALDFFLHARILAQRNGIQAPESFDQILNKMLNVIAAVSQTGPADSFGDDDGGRVFNPRRNRTKHLTDPLAIGAILYGRDDLKSRAVLTEEAVWLFGEQAIASLDERNDSTHKVKPVAFEAGGIYVMASSEPFPVHTVIDAGPQGIGHSGHGHADALSVRVSLNGQPFLIDAGAFCYMCEDRDKFRGTGAHNTLKVDGVDQAVPEGPFAWSSLPDVRGERWITGSTFTLFAGSHTGYTRLTDPVIHLRIIFHLHGTLWLVRDVVEGQESHQLETSWHFAPDIEVREVEQAFLGEATKSDSSDHLVRMKMVPVEDLAWHTTICSDLVSPAYGIKEPAPAIRISANIKLPAEHAIILQPLTDDSVRPSKLTRLNSSTTVTTYRYDEPGTTHWIIFHDRNRSWTAGRWSSDAKFIYFRMREGRLDHLILTDGSFLKMNEEFVVRHTERVENFEWDKRAGASRVSSSNGSAVQAFSQQVIESCNSVF